MADPVTLTAISVGATLIGGATSAYGAYSGGQAQNQAQQYQAGIAQVNKQIALQNADYARKTGEVQAQASGMDTRFKVGAAKVAQGASGLDVNTGSPSDVRESIHAIGEQNQAVIRANAAKVAYGHEVEATGEEAKSTMARLAGANAERAGTISAVGTLLGTAGSVSSKWLQGNQAGIWGASNADVGGTG